MSYIINKSNYKTAIVILNYLNYEDTINCVASIQKNKYDLCGVVIVDNGSNNGSYEILKKQYLFDESVYVVDAKRNLGFARGNNIGISFARNKLKADFVFCCNNDVIFLEKDYFTILLKNYESGVGVLGSKIINANEEVQPRFILNLNWKALITSYLNTYAVIKGTSFDLPISEYDNQEVIHGCAVLFTPDFFEYYSGFYKRTFLYYEEPILFFMCNEKQLRQVYVEETKIMHLEDKSSEMSFMNDINTIRNHSFHSMKYLIWWSIRNAVITRIRLICKL